MYELLVLLKQLAVLFFFLFTFVPITDAYASFAHQQFLPRSSERCPWSDGEWHATPSDPIAGQAPLVINETTNYYEPHQNGDQGIYKRSSCPAMNTLANRGYLPRTGRNITAEQFLHATKEVYNFGDDNIWVVVAPAFALHGNPPTIDLDNLNDVKVQHAINCPAAPTRNDIELGDNIALNRSLYDSLISFSKDQATLTLEDMAEHQHLRHNQSAVENPAWRFGNLEAICGFAQYTNLYGVLGRPGVHGLTTLYLEDVETFYLKEDLPEKYQRRQLPYYNPESSAYMDRMAAWIGFEVTRPFPVGDGEGALKDVEPLVARYEKPCPV